MVRFGEKTGNRECKAEIISSCTYCIASFYLLFCSMKGTARVLPNMVAKLVQIKKGLHNHGKLCGRRWFRQISPKINGKKRELIFLAKNPFLICAFTDCSDLLHCFWFVARGEKDLAKLQQSADRLLLWIAFSLFLYISSPRISIQEAFCLLSAVR